MAVITLKNSRLETFTVSHSSVTYLTFSGGGKSLLASSRTKTQSVSPVPDGVNVRSPSRLNSPIN
jgi:hypothetical protein